MKCNIKKNVTDNALREENLSCIAEGLSLLEEDVNGFLEQKNFKETTEENATANLGYIASVRKQLEEPRQSFSLNELKSIYVGLNFLRDDIESPPGQRSEFQQGLTEIQLIAKQQDVTATRQKITAAFTRMGVDIQATLRGF